MPLKFVEDCCELLVSVDNEIYDVCSRSVGKILELLGVNSEKKVLYSATVEIARNESFAAEFFDDGLVADLAAGTVKRKMLHFS